MNFSAFARWALAVTATSTVLSGCSGASAPAGTQSVVPFGPGAVQRGAHDRSWMLPDARKKKLLYVSDFYGNDVLVFSYPRGKAVGVLSGISEAQGECASSAAHGNWWVVATGANEVLEYAHGGTTPIATLDVTAGQPGSCAVDPLTGNVAVTIVTANEVVVFQNGSGGGTTYLTPISPFFCAYDRHGNLFVDGSGPTSLAELPKGASLFQTIALNQTIVFAGGVQWQGNLLAVGDQETSTIYQFAIDGSSGTQTGATPLDGGDAGGFWIQQGNVIAPRSGAVSIWKYPAGGSPVKNIKGNFEDPIGTVVSAAP